MLVMVLVAPAATSSLAKNAELPEGSRMRGPPPLSTTITAFNFHTSPAGTVNVNLLSVPVTVPPKLPSYFRRPAFGPVSSSVASAEDCGVTRVGAGLLLEVCV